MRSRQHSRYGYGMGVKKDRVLKRDKPFFIKQSRQVEPYSTQVKTASQITQPTGITYSLLIMLMLLAQVTNAEKNKKSFSMGEGSSIHDKSVSDIPSDSACQNKMEGTSLDTICDIADKTYYTKWIKNVSFASHDVCDITHGSSLNILKCFHENEDLSHLRNRSDVSNLDKIELANNHIIKQKYVKFEYPASHWANHIPSNDDKNFIASLEVNGVRIALKMNPTDARGYRSIVALLPKEGNAMSSTFNRAYTLDEEAALSIGLTILAAAYKQHGMAAQISIAGNNAQSVTATGVLLFGNEKEPSVLHGHVIGRGNPDTCYINNVPLKGPKAGQEMNLRGDGAEEGNKRKEKWKDADMELVAATFASQIKNIIADTRSLHGVKIISLCKMLEKEQEIATTISYKM